MNNQIVTTGPINYAIGSTKTFRVAPKLNGVPWDLNLGSATLFLTDPNGNTTTITAQIVNNAASATWTVAGPSGIWTRQWSFTDVLGNTENSIPRAFGVVGSGAGGGGGLGPTVPAHLFLGGPLSGPPAAPQYRLIDVSDFTAANFLVTPYVVFASGAGVPMNANLFDASVGTDATSALQTVIDQASSTRRLILVIDGPVKVGNLKLRSGVTLCGLGGSYNSLDTKPTSGIIQAPGTTCAIQNYHQTSNYNGGSPVTDYSTIVDQDITIRDLFINGNRGTGGTYNANGGSSDPRTLANGSWISPIQMWGVRNLHLDNVYVYDPATFHFWLAYIDGASISRLEFCDPQQISGFTSGRNTDGLHITGPARDMGIRNLAGWTGDDFLALNANDGPFVNYNNSLVYCGDITNVVAKGLDLKGSGSVCRVLTGVNLADNIIVSDAVGIAYFVGYEGNLFAGIVGAGNGNWGRIALLDWSITYTGSLAYADIGGNYQQLVMRGHFKASPTQITDVIKITQGTLGNVTIDGWHCYDTGTVTFGAYYPISVIGNATIKDLQVSNSSWTRTGGAKTFGFVYVNSSLATVTNCSLSNLQIDGANAVFVFSAGTVSSLLISGIQHKNADSGNGTVTIQGTTLPRLRAAGLDTAQLLNITGDGSVTSNKNDGTQDA